MKFAVFAAIAGPLTLWAEPTLVQSIRFEGASRVPAIHTKAGEPLDPARLSDDVRRLWATGRFEDIQVEEAGGDVVFRVRERPRLLLNEVRFAPGSEHRNLGLKRGTPVDRAGIQMLATAVRSELRREGYPEPRVSAALVPVGRERADLRLSIEPGERVRFGEMRFIGSSGLPEQQIRKALRASRSRTIIPGVWRHRPPFSDEAAASEVSRVQSAFLSRGYFDATARLDGVSRNGDTAEVTIAIDSGRQYRVEGMDMVDLEKNLQFAPRLSRPFKTEEFCRCLFDLRRAAEREGRLDFDVSVQAADSGETPGAVDLRTSVATGPPYTVRRIEFKGNGSVRDSTVRRAFTLEEAQPLDLTELQRSLNRLNQLGFFEPLTPRDIRIVRQQGEGAADVLVHLKERPRGRWFLSGPVGPFSVGGPLQAAVTSRLPGWGGGIVETSTYYLTLNVTAFSNPVLKALNLLPKKNLFTLFAVERPYLPGQSWQSGFVIAPQLGWKGMAASYGANRFRIASGALLRGGTAQADVIVPVERLRGDAAGVEAGAILCEPRRSRWSIPRKAGAVALEVGLPWVL